MSRKVTIIMYHYVRDLENSRYLSISGLATHDFRGQVAHIQKHYEVISAEDLIQAVSEGVTLPPNAALLTFDDELCGSFYASAAHLG